MTVEKTIARKSLAVVLALALGVLPGGFAWSNVVARPALNVTAVPTGSGVGVMHRVTLPALSLSAAPSASLTPTLAPTLAPSVTPAALLTQSLAAPAAADAAVERHPVIGILNGLRAAGVELPETLTAADAPKLAALADRLPEGSAKRDIMTFAHALGQRGGAVDASAASRAFDGMGKAAGQAVGEAVVAAAPRTGFMGMVNRLIGRGTPAPAPQEPAKPGNPADLKVPLNELRWVPAAKDLPASTKDVKIADKQIVGQDEALKAIRFGLKMGVTPDGSMGRNYNMFVSGPEGSGRETALRHLLEEIAPKMQTPGDYVTVANFEHPEKPVILPLPQGKGAPFVKAVRQFVAQAKTVLPKALEQGAVGRQKQQVLGGLQAQLNQAAVAIKAEATAVAMPDGFKLDFVVTQDEEGRMSFGTRLLHEGKMVELDADIPGMAEAKAKLEEHAPRFQQAFMTAAEQFNEAMQEAMAQIGKAEMMGASQIIAKLAQNILAAIQPEQAASPEIEAIQKRANAWQEQFAANVAAVNVEGFGIAMMPGERGLQFPYTYQGELLSKQKLDELHASGAVSPAKWATIQDALKREVKGLITEFRTKMAEFNAEAEKAAAKTGQTDAAVPMEAMMYVQSLIRYASSHYQLFLGRGMQSSEADEDSSNPLMALLGGGGRKTLDASDVFSAELLVNNARTQGAPVVWEKNPTVENLFGLNGGSFYRANGGYLMLNARDVLYSGAWPAVQRAIRNGEVQIADRSLMGMLTGRGYRYSIPNNVKVVLIGSPSLRMMLAHYDEDFSLNFQAVAEFEPRVTITEGTVAGYVQVITNMVAQSGGELLHFTREAISEVLARTARMADSHKKMTAQFGAVYGVLREASFWAREAGRSEVRAEDVTQALKTKQDREETYRRHLIDVYKQNVFVVETDGKSDDQINGLAVMGTFGVPMRVTFTVSRAAGAGGIVSVDRNAGTTGSSFNKALGVVEGFLERTFARDKAFPAKITVSYEQNYGGIDGDSATSTEIYGILASIAEVKLRQDIAITGSADQKGNVQAIGGVNEKIEGFFELAKSRGLTGDQGIIIPKSNVADLQLSAEVAEAVAQGKFHIYAVDHVSQGVEILTGVAYSEVLKLAAQRLKDMRLAGMREQMEAKKELGIK